ncbi:lipase family protein [Nocardioides sp. SR21]|uniref:lipase family protein n=1 Tax=Nocardioides sp. SR21 TaxID=2919501 RepID=UPI001FA9CE17|nr:lipase family protein [Nocardioides sp. SR21]
MPLDNHRPPSADPFYDAVASPAAPGRPVRIRPVPVSTGVPAAAWQVVHGSTDTLGHPNAVSGTVIVPEAPWTGPGPRPVVGYGAGVHGLGRDAAPSHLLRTETESEVVLVDLALARGWAIAFSDGEGLGLPGPHTYGAGRAGGQAMLDLVRAAHLVAPELDPQAPVLLWGYSEGGRNAAWAAELHPAYAPGLPLVAVAAGGVPADLYETARTIDGGPYSGLNLAVLVGLARAYERSVPELPSILSPAGRAAAAEAATLDVVGLVLGFPEPLATWTRRSAPWDDPTWRRVLAAECLGQRAPAVATYLYHAAGDEIVLPELARRLAHTYEAAGREVTWAEVPAGNHLAGAHLGAGAALDWLADQLDQRVRSPLPSRAEGWRSSTGSIASATS